MWVVWATTLKNKPCHSTSVCCYVLLLYETIRCNITNEKVKDKASFKEIAHEIQKIIHRRSLCFVEIGHNQKDQCIKIFEKFIITSS